MIDFKKLLAVWKKDFKVETKLDLKTKDDVHVQFDINIHYKIVDKALFKKNIYVRDNKNSVVSYIELNFKDLVCSDNFEVVLIKLREANRKIVKDDMLEKQYGVYLIDVKVTNIAVEEDIHDYFPELGLIRE